MIRLLVLVKNKVIFYLVSRYLTYFIQFITSLIIAVKLGPYYMGIWGFVLLLLNYFQQCNFGIANSFNVLYIHNKENKEACQDYIANSIILLTYLCLIVVIIYLCYLTYGIPAFDKYYIDKFFLWVCVIAILQYYQVFLVNLFRVSNKLYFVAFSQSIVVFLNFVCIFFFSGENLIFALVLGYIIGYALCVIIAICSKLLPSIKIVKIQINTQLVIIKKGLFLFLYNSCFYFIIISIRTIISAYYSVEEFGLFSFSFTVAHAILLLLEAMSFIIFPKVISKLSSNNNFEVTESISFLRNVYITAAHLLIYIAIVLFPFFVMMMPKYEGSLTCLNLISLSILINSNVTGYAELLIAKSKEKLLSFLSFFALLTNCIIGLLMVEFLNVSFDFVILSTMFAYFLFSFSVMLYGEKLIHGVSIVYLLRNYFPMRLSLPYLSAVLISVMQLGGLLVLFPLLLFLILNYNMYYSMRNAILKILHRPTVVNV